MGTVLVINASCRAKSNSSALGLQIAKGAEKAGHTVTVAEIGRLRIEPCRGCMHCLKPNVPSCIIKDDMQQFYPLLREAEAIVFASPVYWFTMCGQTKQFLDRCFAVAVNPSGGASPFAGKKIAAAFAYGDTDVLRSGCVNAVRTFQDICAFTGAEWLGAVYGTADGPGEMMENAALLKEAEELGLKI